jgi:acetyl-CoA synthetase
MDPHDSFIPNNQSYDIPQHVLTTHQPHIQGFENYKKEYERSIHDSINFWREKANEYITWFHPFTDVKLGNFDNGDVRWFLNGKLNVCYNCVDRHVVTNGKNVAIIHEGNEPTEVKKITYEELLREICRLANVLKRNGVRKGDCVCIYMPMIPEAAIAILACARIGAVHSVVFGGFSAEALATRIDDCKCKVVITADQGKRGEKLVNLKDAVDQAVLSCEWVERVFIFSHTNSPININPKRDRWVREEMANERPYCPCEWMDSEDPLFLLYTSGSTGKPKGVLHTQAGYLLYTTLTHKYVFDYHPGDIYACLADVGWITGHSYIVYGPLSNGATTLFFESLPVYPNAGRYWDMVERHKINILYTAPTVIRTLMAQSNDFVTKYDRSSLRILGSVGEPINPAAWEWYFNIVGDRKCAVVDTYWQTETGGIIISPLPGCIKTKPGSATFPFFGIEPVLLDEKTGTKIEKNGAKGVLCIANPWPSITRTVYGNHERYMNGYLRPYHGYYFTGDGAYRDNDGYYWITGRVDDVLNVSAHRLGTAEIEGALNSNPICAESAVIGVPHDVKGTTIHCYCILKEGIQPSKEHEKSLIESVRTKISPIATPEKIFLVSGLPKTRSGKIMRRLLRNISTHNLNELGDISTLADTTVVQKIIEIVQTHK